MNNIIEFPKGAGIDLDAWVSFILPEEDRELSNEEKKDIYDTFMREIVMLSEYMANRQKKTNLPDRLLARALIQLGQSHDQELNKLNDTIDKNEPD